MKSKLICMLIAAICIASSTEVYAAFGGKPPLGPKDYTRQLFAPYDLVELNYLGTNYCENLFDMRVNVMSYTHQDSDSPTSDAWHLQYPDDMGRFMEAIAWESEYSPVVRLELERRMAKGMMAAHIPGTKALYFFRHRNCGKTYLILDDESSKSGRVTLTNFQDYIEGFLKVGFRAKREDVWHEIDEYTYKDKIENAGSPGTVRSPQNWNLSPYIFDRRYTGNNTTVDFSGRYWLSNEDKPVEYAYMSADADSIQIVIGEPGKPMPILRDAAAPGFIHLPDRKTVFASDKTGDISFNKPKFNHMILRKEAAWGTWGYSTGVLIMWDGKPVKIEALAENGYGQIRIGYSRRNGKCGGRIWLYPFTWINPDDMTYIHRIAETFQKTGKLGQNGYPSLDFVNAAPSGLAAAAYMLTKYNDPLASTIRIKAGNAVDEIFDGELNGKKLIRVYFPVRAAAWMVKTARLIGDRHMITKYTNYLDIAMKRMLSAQHGYDGNALPGGWEHFHLIKAAWLAYDATSNPEYRKVWERALSVYTIDENGIYRYGKKMDAPGSFDTYFGAMPLGAWGHAGLLDNVSKLINLNVPAGWQAGAKPVKDLFHDTGCGPWSQDDANPDFVGFCLRGLNIPTDKQYVIPVGSFPIYDAQGNVQITKEPMVINPFFLAGIDPVIEIWGDESKISHDVKAITITPNSEHEEAYLIHEAGSVKDAQRVCTGKESLTYKFRTTGSIGAAVDLRIMGDGYKVEVSPDGKHWYRRLDTWNKMMGDESIDLSFLAGNREQLLNIATINSENDSHYLATNRNSRIERGYCRYVDEDGELIYRMDLPNVKDCYLELMAGNSYRFQYSSDGEKWHNGPDSSQTNGGTDAAWTTMLNVSDCLKDGDTVYLRLTNNGDLSTFDRRGAFVQRISIYGTYKSGWAYIKISNTEPRNSFSLEKIAFRTWAN